jgi:predicted ATPase
VLLELKLSAFKCFSELSVPLRRLTLLAGVNGAGKSTVLQGLVLLHQALADSPESGAQRIDLPVSGSLLTLGSVRDVVNKTIGGKSFAIGVAATDVQIAWKFQGGESPRDDLVAAIERTTWAPDPVEKGVVDPDAHRKRRRVSRCLFPPPFLKSRGGEELRHMLAHARYVPADRLGPSEVYPLLEARQHATLGPHAERAVGSLYWRRDESVAEGMLHPDRRTSPLMVRQVEAWLGDLFPGVVIDVQRVPNANLATLAIRTSDATDFHRPQHVGFGMTYVLPVIVALVLAAPGDLVLVENPEAHLHPRAQVAITGLCIRAAQSGIQVLLETHSDHVVNSVRVAVHRGRIPSHDVGIHFFERPSAEGAPSSRQLRLDRRGRLDDRPADFFDEIERQLSALLEPPDPQA